MSDDFVRQVCEFGALEPQLVDLATPEGPNTLRYADMRNAPAAARAPVVFESQGQPRAFVYDGRQETPPSAVTTWVRRVAFRGDAEWVAVLAPGRLDVYRAELDGAQAPTPLKDLPVGAFRLPALVHAYAGRSAQAVQARLLNLLKESISQAKGLGVDSRDALSLVGRGLFWRFLIDRGLLEGLRCEAVCPRADGWPDCLANKAKALETFDWLDATFNGSLLPFATARTKIPAEAFSKVLGNIAHLADPNGQMTLRLPDDWSEVNFAHVPVGLLSEVYESYVHEEHATDARAASVFYTPRHIAEFVVEEALDAVDHEPEPRLLDPAAGAGVFLVAAFRALVSREWRRTGVKPSRRVVRRILNKQLAGFDISDTGLRLTELALYLTAIELDPERHPRPLRLLKFDALRDRVLFLKEGGIDLGSLAPVEERFRAKFDAVIGNPPWTACRASAKDAWSAGTKRVIKERLGEEAAEAFTFQNTNPDVPFVYRALEWCKPGGSIALVTHARWLFERGAAGEKTRAGILATVHVTGILNGTALRDTNVWPNVRGPFCLLFAVNELPPERAALLFVSPMLDRMPDRDQEVMRIDWNDASEIEAREVIERPWALKSRFRGSSVDDSIVFDLQSRGVPLCEYLKQLDTGLRNGYQQGAHPAKSALHMHRLPDIRGSELNFIVDAKDLPHFSLDKLHRPRDPETYRAPLLIVHESMRVDEHSPRAGLCLDDLAFDERFDGASFARVADGEEIAAYLQLLIQSSLFQHALLMLDGQYGIEREVVHLRTIKSVPVVPWARLSREMKKRSASLSRQLLERPESRVFAEINRFAFDVFDLSDVQRDAIADTLATSLPTADGKREAVRPTTRSDREEFIACCEAELRAVLDASGETATVRLRDDIDQAVWYLIQVDRFQAAQPPPPLIQFDPRRFVEAADESSASLVRVRFDAHTDLIGVLDRYRYWTRTRARMLATSLVAEAGNNE